MKKNNIVIYSEIISAISSLLIGIGSYVPANKIMMVKIISYISLSKSFNLINCNIYEYIHHFINAYMCVLFICGNNIESDEHIEQFNIITRPNISTFFLILSYYYKNVYIKMLFITTFIYYRSIFIYNVINGFSGLEHVCSNHVLVSQNTCNNSFIISNRVLSVLNIYWIWLILKKIYNQYPEPCNIILRYGSSSVLVLPLLTNYKISYYELSQFSLACSSMFYHNNLTELSYNIDSIFIINSCLCRTIHPFISIFIAFLTYKSWRIKQLIYLYCAIHLNYDIMPKYRSTLIFGYLLCSICFMHYSKHNKWTIANSWGWHIGNGIVIYLGKKAKYNY